MNKWREAALAASGTLTDEQIDAGFIEFYGPLVEEGPPWNGTRIRSIAHDAYAAGARSQIAASGTEDCRCFGNGHKRGSAGCAYSVPASSTEPKVLDRESIYQEGFQRGWDEADAAALRAKATTEPTREQIEAIPEWQHGVFREGLIERSAVLALFRAEAKP